MQTNGTRLHHHYNHYNHHHHHRRRHRHCHSHCHSACLGPSAPRTRPQRRDGLPLAGLSTLRGRPGLDVTVNMPMGGTLLPGLLTGTAGM